MRVLLAHKYHSLVGGAEVFYFEVARILREHGHTVAFFSTESPDNLNVEGVLYTVRQPSYMEGGIVRRILGAGDMFYSSDKKQAMLAAIDDFKPDIVHAFAIHVHLSPSILEAAKEKGVPVVMSCNDYKHICPNYKLYDGKAICEACKGGRFYQASLKRCCKGSLVYSVASTIEAYVHQYTNVYKRFVDRYLFSSTFMLEKTKEFWAGFEFDHGFLRNPFNAAEYRAEPSGVYALYFGRIVEEKGVDRIVEAARYSTVPIKIVGDGPELEALKGVVESQGLKHVSFLGALWGDDLKNVLYKARFVIVPSLWHENFPYVIFQAFAAGKPVIGSMRGGIPELVNEERGLLFDPDHVGQLVECMNQLWEDPVQCASMGRSARKFVESQFSDEAFYQDLMLNYRSVIA